MTVSYTAEVTSVRSFGCFLKLLKRWRGSIYKLIWRDLIVFLVIYYSLNSIYQFVLNDKDKRIFESMVHYCNHYSSLIPLSFVLGFYVTIVMQRWWDQYITIPWPDNIAVFVSAHLHGQDDRGRVMRRTIMRYVCLCLTMVLTMMAPRVKKRFPTLDYLVDAGLLLENEKQVIEDLNKSFPKYPKHWIAIVWAASIVTRARKEGRIRDDFSVKTIIDALNKFRGRCGQLLFYDNIGVPLVYTQVVTLAVYTYFICNVIGHQWTEDNHQNFVDLYFPIFTTLQFFFYMGWLKVAESLINPFGDDDDDFEVNWMIDRNLQVSYLIVDEMHHEHPELVKDQYWDEVFPNELPYQPDNRREEPPEPSTAKLDYTHSALLLQSQSKLDLTLHSSRITNVSSHISATLQRLLSRDNMEKDAELHVDTEKPSHLTNGSAPAIKHSDNVRFIDERTPDVADVQRTASELTANIHEIFKADDGTMKLESGSSLHVDSISSFVVLPSIAEGEVVTGRQLDDDGKDDFDRLKEERDRERLERQKQKIVRGIGAATNLNLDAEAAAAAAAAMAQRTETRTPTASAQASQGTSQESVGTLARYRSNQTTDSVKTKEQESQSQSQPRDPAA